MQTTNLNRSEVERLVREVLTQKLRGGPTAREQHARQPSQAGGPPHPLVVNVSARHMHVKQEHLEILFGPGAKLTKLKDLYQQGEFASEQLVTVVGPRQRIIPNVRILGPMRDYTQIELSYTDGIYLGIDLPLRISGNHKDTPGCTILGPKGSLTIDKGVIRAERHVHMSTEDMSYYGVKDGDYMKLKIDGPCGVTFDRLKVRYHPKVVLEVHIDTDEGNACDLESATHMELIK
ncbi:phosphate propanoyltransferase [Humisphaera borealis]|uniref:Phosphate propanoyltransferase n=2 Tax=Humisphaera borealis TaxID=2807512 RepID=A0A7M2X4D2_9BACT|nr:phosphate propanoyltransferase [Humisphaera borealis]